MGSGINLGFMARSGPSGSWRLLPARIRNDTSDTRWPHEVTAAGAFRKTEGAVWFVRKKVSYTAPKTHTEYSLFKKVQI